MKKYLGLVVMSLVIWNLFGCGQTTSTTSAISYLTATLTHWGFDFNTGTATEESGKYDGGVVAWNPDTGQNSTIEGITYRRDDKYVWWQQANTLTQHHVGSCELSNVTSIPTTWETEYDIWPLLAGHCYVVKCTPEGYAKFHVTSTRTADAQGRLSWEADVQYYFTTGSSFDK